MNKPDTHLKDFIHIEKGIIPPNLCNYIVEDIEKREWRTHSWYNQVTDEMSSEPLDEPEVQEMTSDLHLLLTPHMMSAGNVYSKQYTYPFERTQHILTEFSGVRFNRYNGSQHMRQHHDHIQALFDGKIRGIPILSFIVNLNDDYEGADLYFWDDYTINLGKGDIVMFPSIFLYPHGVTEVKKGTRYSAVSWAW